MSAEDWITRHEKVWRWVVWHLPERLIFWAFVRVCHNASAYRQGQTGTVVCDDALGLWIAKMHAGRKPTGHG